MKKIVIPAIIAFGMLVICTESSAQTSDTTKVEKKELPKANVKKKMKMKKQKPQSDSTQTKITVNEDGIPEKKRPKKSANDTHHPGTDPAKKD